ncbi:MAG TPA: S8 family peptidase [Steroidobacteraceae bacterium]|nr:S8 family peptidase [Steroidobacteraceae bacterium]
MRFDLRMCRSLAAVCAAMLSFATVSVTAQTTEGPPQRLIIKWRTPGVSVERLTTSSTAIVAAQQRHAVAFSSVRRMASGAEVVKLNHRLGKPELQDLIDSVKQDPSVEYVEEDRLMKRFMTPTDSRYNEQWHYFESTAGLDLPAAWDQSTGAGVTVAVLDTGYRPHADLVANIVGGYDFISDTFVSNDGDTRDADARDPGDWQTPNQCGDGDYNSYPSSWHGTHVAGTIAAVTNNSTGVAGVAFGARVVPARVLGRCGGYTSDIADAMIWASGGTVSGVPANPNVARVISLSLGGQGACDTTTQNAINSARSRGTVVVIAAGNENQNAANVSPANCSGVIVVAAVNRSGGRAYYSNYGSVVDVAAPGGDVRSSDANGVLSTLNTGTTTPGSDTYAWYQGTSMATPHVSGVVALMLAKNGSLTPDDIESRLKGSTRAFPATCSQCGTGIVDALAAVNAATGSGGGESGTCPAGFTEYTGTLSSRSSAYLPSSSGFSAAAGLHSGRLSGPASADFDLYLQRRSGSRWSIVARSEGTTSTESIDYNGSSSTYRWRVYAYSGSGSYTLCVKRP